MTRRRDEGRVDLAMRVSRSQEAISLLSEASALTRGLGATGGHSSALASLVWPGHPNMSLPLRTCRRDVSKSLSGYAVWQYLQICHDSSCRGRGPGALGASVGKIPQFGLQRSAGVVTADWPPFPRGRAWADMGLRPAGSPGCLSWS